MRKPVCHSSRRRRDTRRSPNRAPGLQCSAHSARRHEGTIAGTYLWRGIRGEPVAVVYGGSASSKDVAAEAAGALTAAGHANMVSGHRRGQKEYRPIIAEMVAAKACGLRDRNAMDAAIGFRLRCGGLLLQYIWHSDQLFHGSSNRPRTSSSTSPGTFASPVGWATGSRWPEAAKVPRAGTCSSLVVRTSLIFGSF